MPLNSNTAPISPVEIDAMLELAENRKSIDLQGENGLLAILFGLNNSARHRGAVIVPSVQALQNILPGDARIALVDGNGIYKYQFNGVPATGANQLAANGGGLWVKMFDLPIPRDESVLPGNGSQTSFDITHNQNTLSPSSRFYDNGALPNVEIAPTSRTVLSANQVRVVFSVAPLASGTGSVRASIGR